MHESPLAPAAFADANGAPVVCCVRLMRASCASNLQSSKVRGETLERTSKFLLFHGPCSEEWHHDEVVLVNNEALEMRQLVLPGNIKGSQEVMHHLTPSEPMLEKEKYDLQMCFERLFAARAVMQEKLGLPEPPEVVVCATPKDVPATARRMGLQDARLSPKKTRALHQKP